jgi:hypothetical protein
MKKLYTTLLLICILVNLNAQTTNENISQLKDKNGDVYFRITKSDSIYKFEFAKDDDLNHIIREKTDYEKGKIVAISEPTKKYLELDIKFVLNDRDDDDNWHNYIFTLTSIYNGIDDMFLRLPEKKQDYTRESSDSIFPLITLSVDSLSCAWNCGISRCPNCYWGIECKSCMGCKNEKLCSGKIGLQFRGGKKNAEVCFWRRVENGEEVWSRWMTQKELKLLLKKQVWQK